MMGKTFKLNFERVNPDHPDTWLPYCMNGFGRGYSYKEAETLKQYLESEEDYRNVQVVEMLKEGCSNDIPCDLNICGEHSFGYMSCDCCPGSEEDNL